jgi:hypothetical protein
VIAANLDHPKEQTLSITLQSNAEAMRQQMFGGGPGETILVNHPAQSSTAIDGWKSVLFGVPFLAAGAGTMAAAIYGNPARKNAPIWLIELIGSFFVLAGLFLISHGLRGVAKRAAYKREIASNPGQVWLADHHWHREGNSYSAFNEMLSRLMAAIAWYAFLIPFFWVGLTQHGMPRVFLFVAGIFSLFGIYLWMRWAKKLGDLLRHGNSFLAFDSFPYFLGGTFTARLRATRHFDSMQELTVTLRCVQEKYVTRGTGDNRSTQVVCYELYSDVATFTHEQLTGAASSYLPISFRLPEKQPVTKLSETPPTYWEIEAQGKASDAQYEAYFLVPIYQPS